MNNNRIERNTRIIELAKNLRTNKEIAEIIKNEFNEEISERTIRRIVSDADIKRNGGIVHVCPGGGQNFNGIDTAQNVQGEDMSGHFSSIPQDIKDYVDSIINDRYESLLEKYELTCDRLDVRDAEIASLKSELIEAKNIATQSVTTNDIKSSKKYIIKPLFNDGSSDIYANYDELEHYLPNTSERVSKFFYENSIDRGIDKDGCYKFPLDNKKVEYCTEISIDSLADKIDVITDNIKDIQKEITKIKEQI